MQHTNTVDHNALRSAQVMTIATLIASIVVRRWEPVAGLALVFLITGLSFQAGPFILVYRWLLRPLGLVRPDLRTDHLQPHRFGQAVGAVSAGAAAALLYLGYATAGWILVLILILLTAVSFARLVYRLLYLFSVVPPGIARLLRSGTDRYSPHRRHPAGQRSAAGLTC